MEKNVHIWLNISIPTIPHINCVTTRAPVNYQRCLQVSETISWSKRRCCYSFNKLQHWVGRRGLIYLCNVDYSRISLYFLRIVVVLIVCMRYYHRIWERYLSKTDSYLVFQQILKNIWGKIRCLSVVIYKLCQSINWKEWA